MNQDKAFDQLYVDALRSKLANLQDENIRLEAQVALQAQVIAGLQQQLEDS